jgi:hypothetical protein
VTLQEAQLLIVYALGNLIVIAALLDSYRVPNPYGWWLEQPDATTHTTLGKML